MRTVQGLYADCRKIRMEFKGLYNFTTFFSVNSYNEGTAVIKEGPESTASEAGRTRAQKAIGTHEGSFFSVSLVSQSETLVQRK